jgi:CubicO group peptidase (beta-lactamase class C family)
MKRCFRAWEALLVLTCVHSASAQAHPTAERALRELIIAVTTGDSSRIASYARANYDSAYLAQSGGVDRAVRRWREIRETYGPLTIDTLMPSSSTDARAWVRGSVTRAWLDFRVVLDSQSRRVARVGLGRGLRPAHRQLRHPRLSNTELSADLRDYLAAMAAADLFSGTVLVARGDTVIYEGAFGMADRQRSVRNTPDTRFDLASVGKIFTAVAIAKLSQAGRLSLHDTIARFGLPLPSNIARRVTVAQLLNHTSGLGELGAELDSAMRRASDVPDMVRLLTDSSLSFVPGSSIQYSNRGYIVLGAVIEALSSRTYFDFVEHTVFAPAGMKSSEFIPDSAPASHRALRYSRYRTLRDAYQPGPRFATAARLDQRGGPAGGVFSTVRDLHRFIRAFESDRLVSRALRQTLVTPEPNIPWGYGFETTGDGGYGHRGAAPGATAYLFRFATGHIVAVLSNYDTAAQIVGEYIRERVGA